MLGGHMDSWHSGTGATDNAAGCAVAMEAVRILQALGLKPRRTIRIALWSGEEQDCSAHALTLPSTSERCKTRRHPQRPRQVARIMEWAAAMETGLQPDQHRTNTRHESRVREAECLLQSR